MTSGLIDEAEQLSFGRHENVGQFQVGLQAHPAPGCRIVVGNDGDEFVAQHGTCQYPAIGKRGGTPMAASIAPASSKSIAWSRSLKASSRWMRRARQGPHPLEQLIPGGSP